MMKINKFENINSKDAPKLYQFKDCVGELMYYQNNVGKFEARNPFNRGMKYDGYIFKIKKANLPFCIKK